LDEQLIADGALSDRYKALIIFQADIVEQSILGAIDQWMHRDAGKLLLIGTDEIHTVEQHAWQPSMTDALLRISSGKDSKWLIEAAAALKGLRGVDGQADGIWTTCRDGELMLLNTTDQPVASPALSSEKSPEIPPHSIVTVNEKRDR